ncbi:hypothetical protein GDO81_008596 [Engystomops pustulosus]|uniref:Beta-soluble NSF attachment protein n=1 Tax=Engystomops pustulosus TaxID=76066 RepID=A0AAV7CGH9_ENGPU|nr:hypothetical protein GDO81_008596 [Engystomops pustulosus]
MDSTGKEREAVQLMAEAEKRVKSSQSFLRGLFGGNTKIEEACEMYARAANMFKMAKNWSGHKQLKGEQILPEGEHTRISANKCLLKVAAYAAQLEQYQKAIEIYEQIGTSTMDNPLLKYSAKEYFFKAALCHFIVDELNAKLAVEKYEEMFPAFSDSRECKLIKVSAGQGH